MITTFVVVLLLLIAIASLIVFGLCVCTTPLVALIAIGIVLPDVITLILICRHFSRRSKQKKALREYEEWKKARAAKEAAEAK